MESYKLNYLAGYYSSDSEPFVKNEVYSTDDVTVYSYPPYNDVWLMFREIDKNKVLVTKRDEDDNICLWDTYDTERSYPAIIDVKRRAEPDGKKVTFDADEQKVIYKFGDSCQFLTLKRLEELTALVRDKQTKAALQTVTDKLRALSRANGDELISYIRKRKGAERERSLSIRLQKAKKRADEINKESARKKKEQEQAKKQN